jgi:hypothetical protein
MSESSAHNHDSHGHGDPYAKLEADPFPRELVVAGQLARLVGYISLGLLVLLFFFNHGHAFRSLLFAFHIWLGVSLGCLGFVMISHLTGGGWGVVIRRFGEAGALNIPLMLIFFLILTFGYKYIFPWAHPDDFRGDKAAIEVLDKRQAMYTWWTFTLRTLLYFGIWMFLAVSLRLGSLKLDEGPDLVLRRKLRKISAAGVVLFFVTTTGFALDYVQSRETNWYSSIGGFIIAIGMGQAGMSFMSLNVCYFAKKRPLKDILIPQHTNDLGNILLALVILFMYTNFAQYLIQWNGNMPEDYGYWTNRGLGVINNGWKWYSCFLLIFQFFLPFFLLLMKGLKRNTVTFARICGLILFMAMLYVLWLHAPSGPHRQVVLSGGVLIDPAGSSIYFTDLLALVGIGGLWISRYSKTLASKPLLALNIADMPEIVTQGKIHGTPAHA